MLSHVRCPHFACIEDNGQTEARSIEASLQIVTISTLELQENVKKVVKKIIEHA